MSPLSRISSNATQPTAQGETTSFTVLVSVPLSDRWRVYHRLQELMIPCWCLSDGSLHVEVQYGLTAIILRSVVHQFIASREDMVNWLDRCWLSK